MKKDYTNQSLTKGSFAAYCLLLIFKILSIQTKDSFLFDFYIRKTKWIHHSVFVMVVMLLSNGVVFQSYAQCTSCTYTAPSGGTSFSLNGNETLCITADVSNLTINLNGTNNKVCIASGVVWTKSSAGNLPAGLIVDVYGTLNVGSGLNVNGTPPNAVINIRSGGVVNTPISYISGLTVNNEGILNFTNTTGIDFTGTSILNNFVGGTVNALTTTNFKLGNNATINNDGLIHFANFENEEGYLNNNATGVFIVDRSMNNHGAFINNGDFQLPCNTLAGAAGATTCSFRVGDKGVGKEFITNTCIKVLNGNVTFDGPGTLNSGFEIGDGYNLILNKTVSGTDGSFLVKGGTSTINLSGSYIGTNMKFYDVNTAGNSFDSNFGNNASSFTVSSSAGCSEIACTPPTAVTASSNSPVIEGGSITLTSSSTGGTSYAWTGPNSFSSTLQNPTINSSTSLMSGVYTVTVTSTGTCIATATTSVSVTASTPTCTVPTAVTASSNSPVIEGGSITLTSSSTGGTSYAWTGPNSFSSTLQNPTINSSTSLMTGVYTVTVTSTGTCMATATVNVVVECVKPTITATVTQATCNGTTANNNGKINFSVVNGDKYEIVEGSTFSGTGTYSSAMSVSGGGGSLLNLANPTAAKQYTIRVYNGNNSCFTDTMVTLNPKSCVFECEPFKCLDLKVKIN